MKIMICKGCGRPIDRSQNRNGGRVEAGKMSVHANWCQFFQGPSPRRGAPVGTIARSQCREVES